MKKSKILPKTKEKSLFQIPIYFDIMFKKEDHIMEPHEVEIRRWLRKWPSLYGRIGNA
jgi:hypothetical protein